ncbi:hypothetical protein [Pedobacter jejuensis]|uniref:Uncharacterized protein n=1 Tax=Pedobacter jejuensis TaxID=1268550 RepID=A0A3N0BPI8_9SPHI|nr:hypothetical protein [Pedobacter jejuensis]RNL50756.1 hypothetical protein D7004_17865 [Pedobacter jejuensis]
MWTIKKSTSGYIEADPDEYIALRNKIKTALKEFYKRVFSYDANFVQSNIRFVCDTISTFERHNFNAEQWLEIERNGLFDIEWAKVKHNISIQPEELDIPF